MPISGDRFADNGVLSAFKMKRINETSSGGGGGGGGGGGCDVETARILFIDQLQTSDCYNSCSNIIIH